MTAETVIAHIDFFSSERGLARQYKIRYPRLALILDRLGAIFEDGDLRDFRLLHLVDRPAREKGCDNEGRHADALPLEDEAPAPARINDNR